MTMFIKKEMEMEIMRLKLLRSLKKMKTVVGFGLGKLILDRKKKKPASCVYL